MCRGPRMRLRVHQLHHLGGCRKVPHGEMQDDWGGGYIVCHGVVGLRELCGDTQDTFGKVEAGALGRNLSSCVCFLATSYSHSLVGLFFIFRGTKQQ